MRNKILSLYMIMVLIIVARTPAYATNLPTNMGCTCVDYVVKKLFGGPLSGTWPTADSMATDSYWESKEVFQKTGSIWGQTYKPKANDVIIIRKGSRIAVYNVFRKDWDTYRLDSDGHIGFVIWAKYLSGGNYVINMQSANWYVGWSYPDGKYFLDANCFNINQSLIGVSIGTAVFYTSNTSGETCDGGEGVYLYEHIYYKGRCSRFTGNSSRPEKWYVGNDAVSSIQIIGNWTVTLYEHAGYSGAFSTFTMDDPDLRDNAVGNDRASSLRVQLK